MSETGQPTGSDVAGGEDVEAQILHMGGVSVELGPESGRHEFATGAVGFTDVTVADLWHLSEREIEEFEDDAGVAGVAAKHGLGTYVGGGDLGGVQVDGVRSKDHNRYDLTFQGNVLMVPFADYDDVAWELEEILAGVGVELPPLTPPSRMINKALRENEINGVSYDAFLLYTNGTEDMTELTEGVIFYPERTLEIVARTEVPRA